MGLVRTLTGGLILLLVVLSLATSFTAYLAGTHQNCSLTTTSLGTSSEVSGSTNSSTSFSATLAPKAISPLPVVSADLILTPLDNLSLTQRNSTALSDLANPAFWGEVHASELQTYEEIVPQTIIGFYNSSEEWSVWAGQNLPVFSGWLGSGFIAQAQGQVSALGPGSGGNNESGIAIAQGVDGFAAGAAGLSLASLDFISFNGLTALKTLFETDNVLQAACQTVPGQLAQLYKSSFDPSISQADRADYLGRALAITSVIILISGKDGFADQFQGALDGVGLGDSWPTVKPYLGDIGSKVSDGAASATFSILQTLAQRFPQDSVFVTGFTADRIDSMVDILEKKGVSNDVIQNDIGQIAQAAGASSDDEAAGEAADLNSLQQGGGLQLFIKTGNKLVLYQDASGETATLRGTFLQEIIPGFDPRGPDFVQVHYQEAGVTVYQYYAEKVAPDEPYQPSDTDWNPRAPSVVGSSGDIVTVSFELLTPNQFLESVPPISYLNTAGVQFIADFSEVEGFAPSGSQATMNVEQESFQGVSSFSVDGTLGTLSNSNGNTFIDLTIPNLVDKPRTLKITFDGYGDPALSIQSGSNFSPVTGISSDGVRLKFVSNSGGSAVTVTTLYLEDPSILYTPGDLVPTDSYSISGASQTYEIDQTTLNRGLEQSILQSQDTYDIGIVGSEIAYTVGEKNLGLQAIDMPPASQGGADLYTADGSVIMQARMLAHPLALGDDLQTVLNGQLTQMVKKLGTDFDYHPGATTGYAVLSYVDPTTGVVKTLVAVVPKQ